MRKFLLYVCGVIAATVVILLVSDAINRWLVFSSSNANPYKMYRLFVDHPDDEIVILGSSRAEFGFSPGDLSEKAFNYGLAGSTTRESVFHLRAAVARPDKGLILFNLDPWGIGYADSLRGNYRFAQSAPLVKAEPLAQVGFLDTIPGVRFHGQMRGNFAEYMNNKLAVTKTMEQGAVLQRISRTDAEWQYMMAKAEGESGCYCNERTMALLEQVLRENREHEIVFVISPSCEFCQKRFTGQKALDDLKTWLLRFPHVHVYDHAATGVIYDISEFMDLTHLNEHGARRFTKELKAWLEENHLLWGSMVGSMGSDPMEDPSWSLKGR